jgi:hypothetical protein
VPLAKPVVHFSTGSLVKRSGLGVFKVSDRRRVQ